jgi:hypothetical protein
MDRVEPLSLIGWHRNSTLIILMSARALRAWGATSEPPYLRKRQSRLRRNGNPRIRSPSRACPPRPSRRPSLHSEGAASRSSTRAPSRERGPRPDNGRRWAVARRASSGGQRLRGQGQYPRVPGFRAPWRPSSASRRCAPCGRTGPTSPPHWRSHCLGASPGQGQGASLRLRHPTPGCCRTVAVLAYAKSRNRRGHGGGPRVGRGEEELEFVWDTEVRMPERARVALELMHVAVARHGGARQPPWPVTLSSVPGRRSEERAHLRDHTRRQCGRLGAVVRPSPEESGTEMVGGYLPAAPVRDGPAPQMYWETWAGFLGTRAYCWSPVCSGRAHRPDPQRLLASDLGPGPRPCRAWRSCTSASPWTWALHLGTSCILQAPYGPASRARG